MILPCNSLNRGSSTPLIRPTTGESGPAALTKQRVEIVSPSLSRTPAIHHETVDALRRQLLQQIDAAVHEADHGVPRARPPVAVALGGLVAGDRERGLIVDEHHVPQAVAHGQVIGGGDAGDPRAAEDGFGGAHAGSLSETGGPAPGLRILPSRAKGAA